MYYLDQKVTRSINMKSISIAFYVMARNPFYYFIHHMAPSHTNSIYPFPGDARSVMTCVID